MQQKIASKTAQTGLAIVTSGKTPDDSDFDTMLDMIKALNQEGIKSCASIGTLMTSRQKDLQKQDL